MQATLIETNENGRIAYDSLILSNPKSLSVLNSKLALKIVKVLADSPCCAIDVARKLKQHEQKVYYYMRKLERAGIIYTISSERRHGMIAKIYSVVSPVIATKLFEKGVEVKENISTKMSKEVQNFFHPFIENGKLNSLIIFGDPAPHGKYNKGGMEAVHTCDLMLFLGSFLQTFGSSYYKLDTEITEENLDNNLILIGNPRTNIIIDRINSCLPIYFDLERDAIVSRLTKKVYDDDTVGVILKLQSPFNKEKKILLLGGIRARGTRAAVIAISKYLSQRLTSVEKEKDLFFVVEGRDKDGDKIIDDIIFLE